MKTITSNKIPENPGAKCPRSLRYAAAAAFLLFFCLFSTASNAQCAMCRAALETGAQTGQAQSVNNGIVYLMVIPYLLVGVLIYFVYKTGKSLTKKS